MQIVEKTWEGGIPAIHYAEGPAEGDPLVLLHGGSARWQSFEQILPELAARWHVFAPDLRGHGRSGRAERYRLIDYAEDLGSFLRAVVGRPAFLFGHSLGGMVALMAAARDPASVRAVLVGDAPLTRESWRPTIEGGRARLAAWAGLAGGQVPRESIEERLKAAPVEDPRSGETRSMADVFGKDHPVFGWLAENLYHHDPAMLRELLDRFDEVGQDYHMHTLFPVISCPVLLLQADPAAGGLMSDVDIARAMQLLARPAHVRLAGVSHVLHNENAPAVLEAINSFLERVPNTE